VVKGDSLASIAARHGVRYQAIAKANGITSPYIIRPGQILQIPDVAAALAVQEKQHAASATATTPQDSGGLSLASLGRMLSEGGTYLHTTFLRNAQEHPQTDLMHASRAPWMVPAQQEFEKGVKRRPGRDQNDPRILEYFTATPTLSRSAASVDETPYCAAFANWCLGRAGFHGTNSALAASFKTWGRPTRGNRPALGAVAVIRFRDGHHHVTFVAGISADGLQIATLGGNQGGAHAVSHSYCFKDRVIAYRYPANYPDYDDDYVLHKVAGDHAPMTAASTH
jgi:flagellar protein FlgJ